MKFSLSYTLTMILSILSVAVPAQQRESTWELQVQVNDKQTKAPLEFALVGLTNGSKHWGAMCNEQGTSVVNKLPAGTYKVSVSLLGYKKWEGETVITHNQSLRVLLTMNNNELNEVVVTASESRGATSSSVIDRRAMQHLQPSSFSDLLELLPGGKAKDPSFSSVNAIRIREVGLDDSKYSISSLGTSFVMDGTPISTDANLQYLTSGDITIAGTSANTDSKRSSVNRGVDMRTLSTDQIERVEVVRGIPSVQYGELTSGLVKIERKKGATPWEARLKVDGYSKLFAVSKGFGFARKLNLNFGVDYLDSKNNPTNSYEGYQRLTYSIRLGKRWDNERVGIDWRLNVDHAHTLDETKVDPNMYDNVQAGADLEYVKKDRYRSKYDRFSVSNTLQLTPKKRSFLESVAFNASASYEMDKIEETKFVQLNSVTLTIPVSDETGTADGIYLPSKYLTYHDVDGRPLSIFLQGKANFKFATARVNHKAMVGAEYVFDKNYGDGQIIDRLRPPGGENPLRSRKYSNIPARQMANFFVEDALWMPLGRNVVKLIAGVRGMTMVGMDSRYRMNGKPYLDPRFNAEWRIPSIGIKDKELSMALSGGVGWHSKFPTLNQIYPDYAYEDYVRLNYYDVDAPEYSRVNYETFKTQTFNYNLEPARNRKWEVRLDMSYDNNRLSVTYFREKMTNGFRSQVMDFMPISTRRYYNDKDSVVINPDTHLPDLEQSKYKELNRLHTLSATGNGTRIEKEGIEFTLSTKRFERLKTRMTVTGAWFKTDYLNSSNLYRQPSVQINGEPMQEIGIFNSSGGDRREQFNTNFMFDTYIPLLGLEFSTSFQCMWFTLSQRLTESRYPYAYVDANGNIHPYTEADKTDPLLKYLTRESNPGLFVADRKPFGMEVNLKASKKIKNLAQISVFVNKLLDYYPDYEINGAVIKRNVSPYFGMELNITL